MIHASAIVDPSARIAADVVVGAGCVIGPDVEIDTGCWIAPHVVVQGPTRIGRDNRVHAFAAIGGDPQDKKYDREPTHLEIGDRNTIREYVTINRGTRQGGGVTRVGD
ncbi:MAG TPA: acyl-[acyl-carrier-protein]--UDP-N-acetylglucosamine O-acyltransferase, partial [Gammaproteobacteria bacterium]|nr:acyl-[acyl-carrier-protein]--UDP-N-acetylglucosamine O-acyltransferase [Gammaproteobacteria bacterium]